MLHRRVRCAFTPPHDCSCAPPLTQPCPDWALTALPDVEELLKLEPDHSWGRAAKERLAKAIEERNKQMTDEMLGTVESSTLPPSHHTTPTGLTSCVGLLWCGVYCRQAEGLGQLLVGQDRAEFGQLSDEEGPHQW